MSSSAPLLLETIPLLIFSLDTGLFIDDSFYFLLS